MARIRNIKPDYFTDAEVCDLTPLHRLLFPALWCHADRDGRLEDKPRELKVKCLPYDDCDVDAMLNDLHDAGFITRYEVDGKRFIAIVGFAEHQRFHKDEKPRNLPPPPGHHASTASTPPQQGADTGPAVPVSEDGSRMSCIGPPSTDPADSQVVEVSNFEVQEFLDHWRGEGGKAALVPEGLHAFLARQKLRYRERYRGVLSDAMGSFHGDDSLKSHSLATFLNPKVSEPRIEEAVRRLERSEPRRRL